MARGKGRACPVSTFTLSPGAQVLWCLRRKRSDVRCVLYAAAAPIEVQVLQDADVILKESFLEESLALRWADAYGDRLRGQGWQDTPADCSPSSAA